MGARKRRRDPGEFEPIKGWANCPGARVVLATEPWTENADKPRKLLMPEHNAILKRIASEEGLACFDFAAAMPQDSRYMPDGIHVTEEGGRLKAELFFKYFTNAKLIAGD